MISVLMSTYNETAEELHQSIDSILGQSYKDIEFIIINDNPRRKELEEILKFYEEFDARVYVIKNKKNIGLAASLNVGIEHVQGEYIARMDADDISLPCRLEKELEFLKKNDLGLVSCFSTRMDETGKSLPMDRQGNCFTLLNVNPLLPINDFIVHPTVLGKTSVFQEVNGYRALVPAEDYDLWLRMVTKGIKIGCMKDKLLRYRVRSTGISQSNQCKQYLTAQYIKKLHKERLKFGGDSFTKKNFKSFLLRKGAEDEKFIIKYQNLIDNYQAMLKALRNKDYGKCLGYALKTIMANAYGIKMITDGIMLRLYRRYLIQKERRMALK